MSLNNFEHVFVIGCYDRGQAQPEEIMLTPTPLALTEQWHILKLDTDHRESVIVARKKDSDKVQVLLGQFAPLAKENNFKQC